MPGYLPEVGRAHRRHSGTVRRMIDIRSPNSLYSLYSKPIPSVHGSTNADIIANPTDLKKQGLPEDSETPIATSTHHEVPVRWVLSVLYFLSAGASGTLTSANSSWPTALRV